MRPGEEFDTDNEEHMKWVYEHALERAKQYGIQVRSTARVGRGHTGVGMWTRRLSCSAYGLQGWCLGAHRGTPCTAKIEQDCGDMVP